jgi:hypothetical protein
MHKRSSGTSTAADGGASPLVYARLAVTESTNESLSIQTGSVSSQPRSSNKRNDWHCHARLIVLDNITLPDHHTTTGQL